jgi:hypothetical protein
MYAKSSESLRKYPQSKLSLDFVIYWSFLIKILTFQYSQSLGPQKFTINYVWVWGRVFPKIHLTSKLLQGCIEKVC